MHKKIARNKPLSARMSAGDEQKGPNVRGFRALSAPRGQIRRDVRGRTKIPRGVRWRRTTGVFNISSLAYFTLLLLFIPAPILALLPLKSIKSNNKQEAMSLFLSVYLMNPAFSKVSSTSFFVNKYALPVLTNRLSISFSYE